MKKRELFLTEINAKTVMDLVEKIIEINNDDEVLYENFPEVPDSYKKYEPIRLNINSNGGSVRDGLALINILINSKTPIITVAVGKVHSMALPIYLCGTERIAYAYSDFAYHNGIMNLGSNNIETVKEKTEVADQLQEYIDNIILNKTSILKEKLDNVKTGKFDWHIDANEATKLGIVTQYINKAF